MAHSNEDNLRGLIYKRTVYRSVKMGKGRNKEYRHPRLSKCGASQTSRLYDMREDSDYHQNPEESCREVYSERSGILCSRDTCSLKQSFRYSQLNMSLTSLPFLPLVSCCWDIYSLPAPLCSFLPLISLILFCPKKACENQRRSIVI